MTTSPKSPLNYRPKTPTPPPPSNWRAAGLTLAGLVLGLATAIAIVVALSYLFPSRSQASTGAAFLFFGGLASLASSVPAALFRRWLLAGLLAGTGATSTFLGFVIGITSGINC